MLAACGCEDVPCANALTLHLTGSDGTAPPAFSGEVSAPGLGVVTFSCPGAGGVAQCGPGLVRIRGLTRDEPDSVRVTITSSAGDSFRGDVEPDYEGSDERGAFCSPACSLGEVAVTLARP